MTTETLTRGATLHRDGEGGDNTFVLIPRHTCDNLVRLADELAQRGLELLDPDESEPEITADGIKVACIEMYGKGLVG